MAKLFGFSIDDGKSKSPSVISPVPKSNQDGVDNYISSGFMDPIWILKVFTELNMT